MSAYSDLIIGTAGLVSYWRLGESSGNAIDLKGGKNGTVNAGVTRGVTGIPGATGDAAMSFSGGSTSYATVTNDVVHQLSTGTVEFWFNTTDAGASHRCLVSKQNAYGIRLFDNKVAIYDWGASTLRDTGVDVTDGGWHHVAATFQSGTTNGTLIYVDGTLRLTTTMTVLNQTQGVVFGAGDSAGATERYTGSLDEIALYNVALSSEAIATHYDLGRKPPDEQIITATAPARGARFLPALFTASKQGQLYDDISGEMIEGRVVLDLDLDGSKMSFEAQMKTKRAVSPFTDFVAPFLRIIYEDGSEDYEQVGLYALVPAPSTHHPGQSTLDGELGGSFTTLDGRDLCWILAADHSSTTISMASGTNVVADGIADLSSGGITRVTIPASSYTSTKAVDWPPGTSRLQRFNDRMVMAGYYTLSFDRHGIGISKPYADLATAEPAVTYTDANGSRIVPPIEDEPDLTRLCNRVVVIGTDPALAPIYAIRENTDPTSPVSYDNLGGVWITRTEENPDIQTQAAANTLADALIRNGASFYRTLQLQTLPDPYRNPREVYALNVSNADGVVADGKWHCSGWELSLNPVEPTMVHFTNRVEAFQSVTP